MQLLYIARIQPGSGAVFPAIRSAHLRPGAVAIRIPRPVRARAPLGGAVVSAVLRRPGAVTQLAEPAVQGIVAASQVTGRALRRAPSVTWVTGRARRGAREVIQVSAGDPRRASAVTRLSPEALAQSGFETQVRTGLRGHSPRPYPVTAGAPWRTPAAMALARRRPRPWALGDGACPAHRRGAGARLAISARVG